MLVCIQATNEPDIVIVEKEEIKDDESNAKGKLTTLNASNLPSIINGIKSSGKQSA